MPKLTNHRRERFCQLYVGQCDFNASKAARSAGYSLLTCASIASELLTFPNIQTRIAELQEAESLLYEMSAAEARAETAALAAFNMADCYDDEGQLIPIQDLPREVSAGLTEIEYYELSSTIPKKIKGGKDKLGALDKIHRLDNSYELDNQGHGEIHIHLDEKDLKA